MRNLCLLVVLGLGLVPRQTRTARKTVVSIEGREFLVNGRPRLEPILDRADERGIVAIVGFFYQAQERPMDDEQSGMRAADAATDWLVDKGYVHVLVEVANEADNAGAPARRRDRGRATKKILEPRSRRAIPSEALRAG